MFPVLDLGPFAIQSAGLFLLLSLWIGIWLTGKFAQALGANEDGIENGILYALLAGLIGSRLGFLLQNPNIFLDRPASLLSLSPTMLDPAFGVLVGLLVLVIIYQKQNLPLWPTLDSLTPLLILLFAGVQLANLAKGNAYGLPTTLPWGVVLWNESRHPVQIYTLLLTAALFLWWFVRTRRMTTGGFMRSGILFGWVSSGLALIVLLTQAFVAQKTVILGVDLWQLLAFFILAASLYLIHRKQFFAGKRTAVFLSLGSNQNPTENLTKAVEKLGQRVKIRQRSSLYRSQDVRRTDPSRVYANQVLEIETSLPYDELTAWLKALESQFGREPGNKDQVPLDLDVITYGNEVFQSNGKKIPDPGLVQYRYIAAPLAEVSPDFRHPANGFKIQAILQAIASDQQPVKKWKEEENGTTG